MKYIKAIAAIFLFLPILLSTYYVNIKFLKVDVVFYSSIYSAIVAIIIFSPFLFYLTKFQALSQLEKVQSLVICALLGYIFAISVPTIIDRSLSFYILEKLQQRGGGIQLSKFNYVFTNEYMREHQLIDIRLTEQVKSGTIIIEKNCVKLTPRGYKLAKFSRFFRQNLLPKQRLLRGEYTDQLIDPFARSASTPDYICK